MFTHVTRGAAGGQNRAESTAGGPLKRKHAHRNVLSQGNYASVIENGQEISRNDRNELYKRKFDEPNAEIGGNQSAASVK